MKHFSTIIQGNATPETIIKATLTIVGTVSMVGGNGGVGILIVAVKRTVIRVYVDIYLEHL